MSERTISSKEYSDSVDSLIEVLEDLQDEITDAYDRSCIHIEIAPRGNDAPGLTGKAHLIEETLSDGSVVYNIQVY